MEFRVLLQELDVFAARFWKATEGSRVFAFHGAMGAGKTTVISALCRYKGVRDAISSPTFAIIQEYSFLQDGAGVPVYHIDLYRLNNREELLHTGVADCLESGAYCFVEWAHKASFLFDDDTLHVVIETVSEKERSIKIVNAGACHQLSNA